MDRTFRRLARRQLSETTSATVLAGAAARPRDGFVAAIREALDMTVRQFALRLEIAPSGALRLEQRERDETITLGTLRRAADAIDCDLVYTLVPRTRGTVSDTGGALDALIARRARAVAEEEIGRVSHSMSLEAQSVRPADLELQIAQRTADLVETPRRLWDIEIALRSAE